MHHSSYWTGRGWTLNRGPELSYRCSQVDDFSAKKIWNPRKLWILSRCFWSRRRLRQIPRLRHHCCNPSRVDFARVWFLWWPISILIKSLKKMNSPSHLSVRNRKRNRSESRETDHWYVCLGQFEFCCCILVLLDICIDSFWLLCENHICFVKINVL